MSKRVGSSCAAWAALLAVAACEASPEGEVTLRDASMLEASDAAEPVGDGGSCAPAVRESFEVIGAYHVSDPVYDDPPPVGGDHLGCWLDYGVYDAPQAAGAWVHNLEHGAVVVLYRCEGGCPDAVAKLEAFVEAHPRTILTPYPELPTHFGVVAWGERLLQDCLDVDALDAFYSANFNRAPENVPSGAPTGCP